MKKTEQKTAYLALSQDVTYLYSLLKKSLFLSNNFFEKRIVVVENSLAKQWLQLRMAEDPDLTICMGVEFLEGERVFEALLEIFCPDPPKIFPGKWEMALLIQEWGRELDRKLGVSWGKSCAIAEYFTSYSRFGGNMPEHLQPLWNRMQEQYGWISCQEALLRAIQSPISYLEGSLHFFCPRLFTREEVRFLEYVAHALPVWVYQFSPCELFWSDLCSDLQKAHLLQYWEKKTGSFSPALLQLQQLLQDRHPLLANWGSLGRRMAKEWEGSAVESMAYYPKLEEPNSLLQQVQQDTLTMELPVARPQDASFQLFKAAHPREEVEMVYQALCQLFQQQKDLEPKDCVIFVSQLSLYTPHLQAVFGRPHSPFAYSMQDEPPSPSSFFRFFQTILQLKERRWEKADMEALLSVPAFQRARNFSKENTRQLEQWIRRLQVDWGLDVNARKKWLENWGEAWEESVENSLTWENAFTHLFLSAVVEENSASFPIDLSQVELLEKWRRTLWELFDALQPWRENASLPLVEWSQHLLALCKAFLEPDPALAEEGKEYTHLIHLLSHLPQRFSSLGQDTFSADSIYKLLQDQLCHTPNPLVLQAIHIVPWMPVWNKRIIVCMGMGEGDFPRKASPFPGRAPSAGESDRYLLLETLFAAKEGLFFSYSRTTQEGTPQALSPVLQEFFTFLEGYGTPIPEVQASGKTTPAVTTTPPRFFLEKELKTALKPLEMVILPKELPLSQMRSAFRNPISCYCEKQWGFSFPPKQEKKSVSPYGWDALAKFSIRESFLFHPLEEALALVENQCHLPQGGFAASAKAELTENYSQLWKYLTEEGIGMGEIFSVECTPRVSSPTQSTPNLWLFPPLPVLWGGSLSWIVGKLPHVSQKGLIFPRKGDWKTIWKTWPSFLVYCGIVQHFHMPWKQQIFFTETASTKSAFFADFATHLGPAAAFSSLVVEQICPLLPDWVPSFIQEDRIALEEAIQKTLRPFVPTGEERWWRWIGEKESSRTSWGELFGPCARSVGEALYKAWNHP